MSIDSTYRVRSLVLLTAAVFMIGCSGAADTSALMVTEDIEFVSGGMGPTDGEYGPNQPLEESDFQIDWLNEYVVGERDIYRLRSKENETTCRRT